MKSFTILSALVLGTIITVNPYEVKADEIITLNSDSGIKSKEEKVGLNLTQLKENRITQIDFTKIKEDKEIIKHNELSLDELKAKKSELESKSNEVLETIDNHKEIVSNKAIEKTVAKNKVEEIKEIIEEKEEKNSEISIPISSPTTSYSETTIVSTNTVIVEDEEVKESLEEVAKEVVATTQEKKNTELKIKEKEVQLKELESDKSKIEEAIKIKEQELARKKAEEEAKRKAEEEARKAAEKAAQRANIDYTANAVSTVNYSGTYGTFTWLPTSDLRIKDSDFDAPSIKTAQIGYPGNAYAIGQCTWYVYNRMAQIGKTIDPYFGDGGDWNDSAPSKGYTVTNTPVAGSAVSFERWHEASSSVYGHVAFVEHVYPDGTFLISEMNIGGEYVMAWRIIENGPGLSFILPK